MKRKNIAILIILNLFIMITVFSIPTSILLEEYIHSNKIDEFQTYFYSSTSVSQKRELNLNVDIGEVEIKYTSQPVDYLMKLDVTIEMGGSNLAGKSYLDFFELVWQNTSSRVNFTLELKAGVDQEQILQLIKNVFIILTFRADLICDISINVKIQGDIKLTVPWESTIGNILTNITNGNIQYIFNYGIIEGNITGIANSGKIILKSTNTKYTKNSVWTLSSNKNYLSIIQEVLMGANITGTISTLDDLGNRLIYYDDTPEVGARFTLYEYSFPGIDNGTHTGFYEVPEGVERYSYVSDDYPSNYCYDLGLFIVGLLNFNLFSA